MGLLTPDTGTIFWTFLGFLFVFLILKKFAWKPILHAIKERDNSIANALNAAEKAKKEVSRLEASNQKILTEARLESEKIIKEARELKESIINDAKNQAKVETKKMVDEARESIVNEKKAAINDLKKQVAELSISIAEKVLSRELADENKHKELIDRTLHDIRFM
jgi:F-type H+-transporting ATPase subunit b